MRVCFLVGTLGIGGAERQLYYMLRALTQAGTQCRVICLTKGEEMETRLRELGIEVEWVGGSNKRLIRMLAIINNVRKRPADILQSAHFYTNLYAGVVGRLLGIINIGAIRSDMSYELASNKIFGRLHLKLPGHLIANSQVAVSRAVSEGIRETRIDLLKNVVEPYIDTGSDSEGPDESVKILFAGRLSNEKRPDLFLEMAIRLIGELPHIPLQFNIVGDGPLRKGLEHRVLESKMPEGLIRFLGTRKDMGEIYQRTNLLVLTSDHEGTPNVILEALAHGIPVVATRVGGVAAILDDGCGYVVEPGSLNALVAAASKVILDPSLRQLLGENGKQFVEKNHCIHSLGERLINIYSKLQGRNGK